MRIRDTLCLIAVASSALVFSRRPAAASDTIAVAPHDVHWERLAPRLLKSGWRRITDCLRRNPNRRLLQPAYRPRLICFA